ncbi:hypothetical protein DRW41_03705 [Neobacillus piezotolerans]|uniref:WD40 repeat domain-containing protein n=1 Tax=Neobacillus piezotolerans TaxID=2259171 RepID=A0A3D8GX86_9BACI|nr:hypothetical protein [Neobacillus piezotolerans]RDU38676.1 hypothetical protein DRW41_03705 [Neobacillus piezotolerans]
MLSYKLEKTLVDHKVRAVDISPDGQYFATADFFHLYIWSWKSKENETKLKFNDYVNAVVFHPIEPLLVVGCGDRILRVIDFRTGQIIGQTKFEKAITSLKFTRDGSFLGIVVDDTVYFLNWNEQTIFPYKTFNQSVEGIDFRDKLELGVSFGNNVQTFFFTADHSGTKFKVGYENQNAYSIAMSRFGPEIAVAAGTTFKVYDHLDEKFVFEYEANTQVHHINWFDNGKYIAFSSFKGVTIIDGYSYKIVQTLEGESGPVFAVSNDGSKVILGANVNRHSGTTHLWSMRDY